MTTFIAWLRRISTSFIPVALMGVFMLGSLWLLSAATENSAQFGRLHIVLVVINILGLIVLTGLIGVSLLRLIHQYRRSATGSRLTARLVLIFVVMAVTPVSIVFYFSLGFMQKGIDSWFDVRIDRAMTEALELSKSALDMRMRDKLKETRELARQLQQTDDGALLFHLNELREKSGASELLIAEANGRVIASSSADPSTIIPSLPDEAVLQQARDNKFYIGLAPLRDQGLHTRVAISLEQTDAASEARILIALYPVSERISQMAESVQAAYTKYKELVYLREPLKQSFAFTLFLILLVTLLSAVWAAFFFAQRLVAPIRILAIGTRAVAAGNYHKKLPVTSSDELGSLVQSFSEMTQRIAEAQDQVKRSQRQADRERAYLRAVLGRLSSGVMTLDRDLTVRAVNAAASHILGVNLDYSAGHKLAKLEIDFPEVTQFVQTLLPHLNETETEWREEVSLYGSGGHKIITCHGTRLPGMEGIPAGYVVVLEDVTELVRAQRDAAWGEVARRLAHEIKNPLTPIQLSAERLRRKYLARMAPKDAEVLDRSTHTIVQQVQALKEMVQAFSEYAKPPQIQLRPLSLGELVREVLDLYRGYGRQISFHFEEQQNLPPVEADPGRLRQLLHNLIRNAIDALAGQGDAQIRITLASRKEGSMRFVELAIEDNGQGIPDDMLDKLFEPYATTKPRGTGLGLAVVKRIVEEHMGNLFAENTRAGARVVVRLPALEQPAGNVTQLHPTHHAKERRRS